MFIKTVRKSALTTTGLLAGCCLAGWLLLAWPEAAAAGVSRGLSLCSSVIIPSLFPFLVLSGFLVKSGLSASLGRRLERPARALFGLPGCCAPVILIGFIGGYPAGAVAAGELLDSGLVTRAQARRLLCFCVNGGPAFVISAVGAGMLGSAAYGALLYAAHIAASVLLGLLLRRGETPPAAPPHGGSKTGTARPSPASAFVESVGSACRSLLLMCGFILLFSSALSLLDASGAAAAFQSLLMRIAGVFGSADPWRPLIAAVLPGLLEVSCGSVEAAGAGTAAPLLLGMILGWGGLSVHCQIAAALRGKRLITRRFFAVRALHALLGGIFSLALFRWFPLPVPVFSSFESPLIRPTSGGAAASMALLFLCGVFLLSAAVRTDSLSGHDPAGFSEWSGKRKKNML